ncbi:hypothetical protein VaNZ11_009972, partial [Volvox africanus]
MADDIKVINANDLLKGVKLTFHGQAPSDAAPADVHNSEGTGPRTKQKTQGGPPGDQKIAVPSIAVGPPPSANGADADMGTAAAAAAAAAAAGRSMPDGAPVPSGSSLLEGIAESLSEQYHSGEWVVPPGQPNDWRFMLPVCRAALVAWFNPASTLAERLALTEAIGRAFGLDDHALEQAVAESLITNVQIPYQLAVQHAALNGNTFSVGPGSFPGDQAGRAAYLEFRREAMVEAEQLLQQQLGLPEFNGLLQVEVVGATGLKVNRPKSGSKQLLPYTMVWLNDRSRNRRGEKLFTQAATDPERPVWIQQLPPMTVTSPESELVVQVHGALDRNRPARVDPVLGRVVVRLAGLTPGLSQQVDLRLYGSKREVPRGRGGGGGGFLCRCFGDEGAAWKEPDTATVAERTASEDPLDDVDGGKLVFDPSRPPTSGVKKPPGGGLEEVGLLTLIVRYLPERRERLRRLAERSAPGPAGPNNYHTHNRHQRNHSNTDIPPLGTDQLPMYDDTAGGLPAAGAGASISSLPTLAEALRGQLETLHAPLPYAVRRVRRLDSRKVDPLAIMDPGMDFHVTFRKLAAALQALAADGLKGAAALAAVPESGIPLTALGSLGQFLEDSGLETPLERFLPRALGPTGLTLLLLFAKLFRVRPATQQIALLQALLAQGSWMPGSRVYLELIQRLWEPVLLWNSAGRLTLIETEGLIGVNAIFLHRACPLLANQYDKLSGEEAVPCLVLLVEMVGWAVTGDTRRRASGAASAAAAGGAAATGPSAASLHLLIDHMQRAAFATAASISALRPTHDSLASDVEALTAVAKLVLDHLERDMRLQAEIPGLRPLTRTNSRVRYDALADSLETLFMYRPGSSKAASTALWPLEVMVTRLHSFMLRHQLARQPHSEGTPTRSGPTGRRRLSGDDTSSMTGSSLRSRASGVRDTYGDNTNGGDSSSVSPVSVSLARASHNASRPRRRSDGGGATDPRVSGVSGGGAAGNSRRGRSSVDDDDDEDSSGGGGEPMVVLFDLEAAMAEAMAEWAELGGEDLKRQLLRLLERDPLWPPPPATHGSNANGPNQSQVTARPHGAESRAGVSSQSAAGISGGGRVGRALVGKALLSSGAGESAVELFRMLQVYLDVSVERALGGGEQRPALMGPTICTSVVSCVRMYLYHCMRAWEEVITLRVPSPEGATAAGHRHARTISDRFLNALGVSPGAGLAALPSQAAVAATAASAGGGGGLLGSFAVALGAAGSSQLHANSPAVGRTARGLRPHAAPVMPEYGVMPAAAPGAAAMVAALSTAMTPGAGLNATAAGSVSGAGGPHVTGGASQPAAVTPPPGVGPKKGHRRAATAVDADTLAMSHTVSSQPGGGGGGGGGGTLTAAAAAAALPPSTALALASEPGLVACGPLVLIRNTIAAVSEGAEALEGTLGLLGPRPPIVTSKAATPAGTAANTTASRQTPAAADISKSQQKPSSVAVSPASTSSPPPPAFLSRATAELRHALNLASEQCLTSYHLALRGSVLRGLIAAFDSEGMRPPSRAALESVLSALHDELLHVAGGVRQVAVAGAMVHSCWDAAVRCVQALALHQGGFRPLQEQEADVLREFLVSLQDMFGEVFSEHLTPKAKAAAASAGGAALSSGPHSSSTLSGAAPCSLPAVLKTADSRAAGTAYPSALLQCVAASTEDLVNMYSAQMSCLQKMDAPYTDEDGPGIGPGGHQVSLLDLLRLLRQRRRTDPAALTFVSEQLKLVASNATQVLFGLRANERLVATAACYLAPPLAAIGPSAPGSGLSLPLGPMGPGGFRDGCLYVTSRVLGFSTMLAGDLKGTTDVTSCVTLKAVREVAKGESNDTLLVLTHGGDLYQFCGFAPGERDRLCALINGQPFGARIP